MIAAIVPDFTVFPPRMFSIFAALVIPMYVDASAFFIDGIRRRLKKKTVEAKRKSAKVGRVTHVVI